MLWPFGTVEFYRSTEGGRLEHPKRLSVILALVLGAAACTGGDTRVVELPESAMVVTLPSEWHLADVSLTPNLGSPVEVLSVGSFPLNPGGPNCAQIPSQALHDMEPTDVFVTVQETGPGAGSEPRPDTFGPTSGSGGNVFLGCVGPEEQDDIGELHWLSFTDQGRYFYVAVAIGKGATSDDVSAIWSVLDDLVIESKG